MTMLLAPKSLAMDIDRIVLGILVVVNISRCGGNRLPRERDRGGGIPWDKKSLFWPTPPTADKKSHVKTPNHDISVFF